MAGEKYPKAKASAETEIETQKKWRIIVIIIRRHNWFGMRSELKTLADPGAVENWISWGPHLMDGIGIGIGIGETQPSRRFHFAAARWNGDGKKDYDLNKTNEMKKTFQQREKLIKWNDDGDAATSHNLSWASSSSLESFVCRGSHKLQDASTTSATSRHCCKSVVALRWMNRG